MKLAHRMWLVPVASAALVAAAGLAAAGTLDRIGQEKAIRFANREDARPFSYKDKLGEPAGFMVDLCRAVAKKLAEQLNLPSLNAAYVSVTAADRFEAITQQKADILCEPTSVTLSRREQVDFSIPTFLDGAGLMVRRRSQEFARSRRQEDRRVGRHDHGGSPAQHVEGSQNHRRCRRRKDAWRGVGAARRG